VKGTIACFSLLLVATLTVPSEGHDATLLLVRGGRLVTEDSIAVRESNAVRGPSPGKSFLLSALVPGAGQLYQGRRIGWAFVALDAALWSGYFATHSKGNDLESEYRAYADEHYVLTNPDFTNERERGWLEWWSFFRAADQTYAWADSIYWEDISYDREYAPSSYYQEIDVSDVYIYGWADWADSVYNNDHDWRFDNEGHLEFTYSSAIRDEYRSMRDNADGYRKWAGWCIGGALLLRAATAIEALRSARSYEPPIESSGGRVRVDVEWHRREPTLVLCWREALG
jgi:hypothetical protein